jgi:SpoVK/Ycf46/Vps4 family AAA+-type ATPase
MINNNLILVQQLDSSSKSNLNLVAQHLSQIHQGQTINVNDTVHLEDETFLVVECLPFALGGQSDVEKTDWIVLPFDGENNNNNNNNLSGESSSQLELSSQLQTFYSKMMKKNNSQSIEEEIENDDGDETKNQPDPEESELEPVFVLGDFLPTQQQKQQQQQSSKTSKSISLKQITLFSISNLTSVVPFLCDRISSSGKGKQERNQARKLCAFLIQLASKIENIGSREKFDDFDLFVTTTTLETLHLRHHSKISFSEEDNGDQEEEQEIQNNKTKFRLSMIQEENELSQLLDTFAGAYFLIQELISENSSSSNSPSCFAFTIFPNTFFNFNRRIISTLGEKSSVSSQQQQQHFMIENLTVIPQQFDPKAKENNNNSSEIEHASSIILRPLTRNIVLDPVDTSHLIQIRHASCLVHKAVRIGDVISIKRRDDFDDVNRLFAPLASTFESNSRPLNPISFFSPQAKENVFFYVENVKNGKSISTNRCCRITKSTNIAEGSPISHPELFLPVSASEIKRNVLPFAFQSFSRTKSFRTILNSCHEIFFSNQQRNHRNFLEFLQNQQQQEKEEKETDENNNDNNNNNSSQQHHDFKLLLISSSSPKVASLTQLQIALSSLGIYFEVVFPPMLGGIENLSSISQLVCNGNTTSGVLVLYCADLVLYEHSEIVQWLLSCSKQAVPLRVVLITESVDSSSSGGGALAVLNTITSLPTINLDSLGAHENERKVFMEDLISSLKTNINKSFYSLFFSKFLNVRHLAESSAGLFFMELYQWIAVQSVTAAGASSSSTTRTIDSDFLISQLESFKKSHGHTVTSAKLHQVHWKDIGGLEEQREEIMTVLKPPSYLANSNAKRRTGILLMGPPGCGKTLLAKAVATECGMNFLSVKGPELLNMYVGESEKNIREVFKRAREAAPCIVFFDELDALAPARGAKGDSGGVMDRIVAQLLVELDGAVAASSSTSGNSNHKNNNQNDFEDEDDDDDDQTQSENQKIIMRENEQEEDENEQGSSSRKKDDGKKMVFIIGATNRPDLLDPSLLRPGRFDRVSYVGPAETKQDQLAAIRALTRKFRMAEDISFENGNLEKFLNENDVRCIYTGADYYGFCADAMTIAVSEAVAKFQENLNKNDEEGETEKKSDDPSAFVVTKKHFEEALRNLSPSVPMSELIKYQQLRKQYSVQK